MAIIDFFDRGWRINPKGIAYVADSKEFTFNEIGELSSRIANALISSGFAKGAKGAVWSGNDPVAWTCALGLWRAGLVWLPINARNALDDTLYVLDEFDADVVFYQSHFGDEADAVRAKLPKVKAWICIDSAPHETSTLDAFIEGQPATPPRINYDMDDLVAISPTGGTTGKPKGVMNTHRTVQTFVANFMNGVTYGNNEKPVNLAAAPMTHTAGILSLPCTARGGKVVVLPKPDPKAMFAAFAQHKVTEIFLPPTVIYRLLEIPGIEKLDFSSLKYLLYGAAPMSVEKLKKAIEVFGPVMTGGYGQTECYASISILRPEEHFDGDTLATDTRLSSVGRPSPLIAVEIMNDENQPLPKGDAGEICVRGDLVMKGYYKAPEKTAETIIDGWLHTGDIGHIDADGYLYITDRKKDMIISGGFNVYPGEVEQIIWSHPAVQDCAVIGVPDEEWGEAVKAVVEVKPGMSVSAEELIGFCRKQISGVKTPKSIDFVESLPRSSVGKVLKKDLRKTYWKGAVRNI